MTEPTPENSPTRFADLPADAAAGSGCRFCGAPASHRMQAVVRTKGKGKGTPPSVARHGQDYCEEHAVALFVKVKAAMR